MTNRHEQLNHEELLHPADKQVDLALTDLETKQSLHILEGANTLGLPEDMRYMIEHDRVAKGYFLQLLAAIDQPTDALASTQTARHRAKNQFLVYISSISREKATNEELEQALFELPEIQAAIGAYLIQPLVVYFSHYATIRTKLIELMNDPTITDYDRRQLTILPERQQFVEANPLSGNQTGIFLHNSVAERLQVFQGIYGLPKGSIPDFATDLSVALPDELYSKPLQQLIDRYGSETARLRNNKFTDRTALTGVYDQIGTTLGGTPLPATAALFTKQVQTTQRLYAAHKQFRLPPKQESGQQTQEEQTQEEQTQEEQTQEEQTQEEQTQEEQTQEEQTQEEQTQEEQTQEEQTQEEQTQEQATNIGEDNEESVVDEDLDGGEIEEDVTEEPL